MFAFVILCFGVFGDRQGRVRNIEHTRTVYTTMHVCSGWKWQSKWQRAGFVTKCIDDQQQRMYISKFLKGPVPQLLPIQASDISKAILMYAHGGYYADADVEPLLRIREEDLHGRVLGLESNFSSRKAAEMHMMQRSLALWIFHGEKGDKWWLRLAQHCLDNVARMPRGDARTYDYILHTTGPTAWTTFAGNVDAKPIYYFGCGQQHSHSPPCTDPRCFCCHHFAGSWLR